MELKIKKLHPDAIIPQYQTAGAACFDLHAIEEYKWALLAGDRMSFRTGLSFEVPEGFVLLVFSRSGHGFKYDVRLANCVGVIDSDYRGEIMVKLTNDQPIRSDEKALVVRPGDRIAQAMLIPVPRVTMVEVYTLSETARGGGGFGSTGLQ